MVTDTLTSTESPERKPVDEVKEETELPVEQTEVELNDQAEEKTEVEPSANLVEEKSEDETCANQVVDKQVDQNEIKVTYFVVKKKI